MTTDGTTGEGRSGIVHSGLPPLWAASGVSPAGAWARTRRDRWWLATGLGLLLAACAVPVVWLSGGDRVTGPGAPGQAPAAGQLGAADPVGAFLGFVGTLTNSGDQPGSSATGNGAESTQLVDGDGEAAAARLVKAQRRATLLQWRVQYLASIRHTTASTGYAVAGWTVEPTPAGHPQRVVTTVTGDTGTVGLWLRVRWQPVTPHGATHADRSTGSSSSAGQKRTAATDGPGVTDGPGSGGTAQQEVVSAIGPRSPVRWWSATVVRERGRLTGQLAGRWWLASVTPAPWCDDETGGSGYAYCE